MNTYSILSYCHRRRAIVEANTLMDAVQKFAVSKNSTVTSIDANDIEIWSFGIKKQNSRREFCYLISLQKKGIRQCLDK